MAVANFNTWLNASKYKGKPDQKKAAATAYQTWRYKKHGVKPTLPGAINSLNPGQAPAPKPERQKWTPGALDAEGEGAKSRLDLGYEQGGKQLERLYNDQVTDLEAQRPLIEQARKDGMRDVANNTAARGMFRSGIKVEGDTHVGAEADTRMRGIADQILRAGKQYEYDKQNLAGQYGNDLANNEIDSNARSKAAWDEMNGENAIRDANPETPQKRKARQTYLSYLNGRKSTSALARHWDRTYNYGQRFGG